jgi:plastocyanin
MRRLLAAILLVCLPGAAHAEAGVVTGRVVLEVEGVPLEELGPTVVFLDGVSGPLSFEAPRGRIRMHQKNAQFEPRFLAVPAGQSLEMPNDDAIFHNVFSFSKPNDFDLGLYPGGESRSVRFTHPGVVNIYCSIHESMSATVFVSPSPWLAVAKPTGEFELRGVPAGRYRLRVWNERLPEAGQVIEVVAGGTRRVDVPVAMAAP